MTPSKVKRLCMYLACISFVVMGITHPPHQETKTQTLSFVARSGPLTDGRVSDTTSTSSTLPPASVAPDPSTTTTTQTVRKTSPPTTDPTPPETPEPAVEECGNLGVVDTIHCFFGSVGAKATRVADCESSLDPSAISPGGGNWGLFQINTVHKTDFENYTGQSWNSGVLTAYWNTMYALKLSVNGSDWGPWACGGA